MNKHMRKVILFFPLALLLLSAAAQKRPLIEDQQEIVASATKELDQWVSTEDFLEFKNEWKLDGEYVFDITIGGKKGEVLSVYAVGSDAEDVKQQNALKDMIRSYQFGFKMPKGQRYKFEYTFDF